MNRENHHEKCLKTAEQFLKGWNVEDATATRMVASIMMHRDGVWQGEALLKLFVRMIYMLLLLEQMIRHLNT